MFEFPKAFKDLQAILEAWDNTCEVIVNNHNKSDKNEKDTYDTLKGRLENTDTLLLLGYISRNGRIYQSDIVNALSAHLHKLKIGSEKEKGEYTKHCNKIRQSIARRGDALAFFDLIERKVTVTVVEFILTTDGEKYAKFFDDEYERLKGE